ncbi:hypothetical protein Daesc_004598 [Daldinia eschscholtzii]|uniref:RapZ C-terminal domain-containing protein n=1 Tax=Daldinia eschscholtzii TaxID=292717 RepID=A0AAX6MR25_9PEZI
MFAIPDLVNQDRSLRMSSHKKLYIISHDRHTELSPPPDLLYDLRCVPNPPKATRETHTGQSPQIRDGLMHDPKFRELLEEAKAEIHGAMQAAEEMEEEDETAVRVGCLCGSGHHRSVAFSEHLAQMEWPEDWEVELQHRDLVPEVKREKKRERERR